MLTLLMGLVLLLPTEEVPDLEVELTLDPFPGRPRIAGYEYDRRQHRLGAQPVIGALSGTPVPAGAGGKRYRLLGMTLENRADHRRLLRVRSRHLVVREELAVRLAAGEVAERFVVVREPPNGKLQLEFVDRKSRTRTTHSIELPPDGPSARRPDELLGIAAELQHEAAKRRQLDARPVEITVIDDLELPVPAAHLLLLLEDGLMVYQGDTDDLGRWRGQVMPGAYEVYAFAEVPDRTATLDTTVVVQWPRLMVLRQRLAAVATGLAMAPDRVVEVRIRDLEEQPVTPEHLWVTPEDLVDAYRSEHMARVVDRSARLESKRSCPGGRLLLLTSEGLASRLALTASTGDAVTTLMRADVPATGRVLDLTLNPAQQGRLVIDPPRGAGTGKSARVSVEALDSMREGLTVDTAVRHTLSLPAGAFRISIHYRLSDTDDGAVDLLPYRVQVEPGTELDLTPRGPFDLPLYWKRDGKRVSFWLALIDAGGRVIAELPSGGHVKATWRGETFIDRQLESSRFEYAEGFESVDMNKFEYEATIPFGSDIIDTPPHLERTTVYNVAGQSADAPGCLGDRAEELLPAVKQSLEGCLESLGLPDGVRRLHMEFVIFLPPGIDGIGEDDRMTFEITALYPFTGGSDRLFDAYREEFGRVLGFEDDPYILLAAEAIDESRFTTAGYRMLRAREFQRTLDYLAGDRLTETDPWRPSAGVFAGLRLLHGPDVHLGMLTLRRSAEQTMVLHGLSTIERIAALYSLVIGENVAWIFRAHGWPVFDARVDLGVRAIERIKKHPRPLAYTSIEGTPLTHWWVQGPMVSGSSDDVPPWRWLRWPTPLVKLDEDREAPTGEQRFRLFQRLKLPMEMDVNLMCSSDMQLELIVNGVPVWGLEASPPCPQPQDDRFALNRKQGFRVHLFKGDNTIEVAVRKPPGCRALLVELCDEQGKPVRVALDPRGPALERDGRKPRAAGTHSRLYNGDFELGGPFPQQWMLGPCQPEGGFAVTLDEKQKVAGERSLRIELTTPARGAVIQRLLVDNGALYRLSASLRTRGLEGEAMVAFFTTDPATTQLGKTEPLREPDADWNRYECKWAPGTSRVIYLACYVRGTAGTVWFDDIRLEEIR